MPEKTKAMTEAVTKSVVEKEVPGKLDVLHKPKDSHPSVVKNIAKAMIGVEEPKKNVVTEPEPEGQDSTPKNTMAKTIVGSVIGTGKVEAPAEEGGTSVFVEAIENSVVGGNVPEKPVTTREEVPGKDTTPKNTMSKTIVDAVVGAAGSNAKQK